MHVRRKSLQQVRRSQKDRGGRWSLCAIVAAQHVLLCSSAYVIASQVYMLIRAAVTSGLLPTVILSIVSAAASMLYLLSHNVAACVSSTTRDERGNKLIQAMQRAASNALRCSILLWLAACGMNITFTIARQAYCSSSTQSDVAMINAGSLCIIQRAGVGAGLLSLLTTIVLFGLAHRTSDSFRSHLLGVTKEPALLPLVLPYRATGAPAMFSEMSFKCRSSSSLSSRTLVPSPQNLTSHLLPTCPEKAALGLGIYAPKRSKLSFLTPRPSLASIRTHTTMSSLPPPSSPLPPLPAYFPERYRRTSATQKAVYPPRAPRPLFNRRTRSCRTVRMVPPSPALSAANLAMHNGSSESLSSAYSRSISGEKRTSSRPSVLSESSRSYSSSSTATIVKSPLGAMRRVEAPETVVMDNDSLSSSEDSDSEIDDAATLQARLPSAKAIGESVEVQHSTPKQTPISYRQRATIMDEGGIFRRMDFTPLNIRKTRDSAALFSDQHIAAMA